MDRLERDDVGGWKGCWKSESPYPRDRVSPGCEVSMCGPFPRESNWLSVKGFLLLSAALAALIGLVSLSVLAIGSSRAEARRSQCETNLKMIGLALLNRVPIRQRLLPLCRRSERSLVSRKTHELATQPDCLSVLYPLLGLERLERDRSFGGMGRWAAAWVCGYSTRTAPLPVIVLPSGVPTRATIFWIAPG